MLKESRKADKCGKFTELKDYKAEKITFCKSSISCKNVLSTKYIYVKIYYALSINRNVIHSTCCIYKYENNNSRKQHIVVICMANVLALRSCMLHVAYKYVRCNV